MPILEVSIRLCGQEREKSHMEHVKFFWKLCVLLFPINNSENSDETEKLIFSAAVLASLKLHKVNPAWTQTLRELSGYNPKDLIPLASKMIFNYARLIREHRDSGDEEMDISL